jgi:lipid A ethanolaminephosphotransferase
LCDTEGCWDGVLLKKLDAFLEQPMKQSKLIVLHMNGSHGPLYYKRYPPVFEVFKKACKKRDLNTCTEEELVNAYDNTLLYTDYLLNSMIERLKARTDIASLFLYASDHGESLGEYNLFLHGFPYFIAPKEQKEIPFLVYWNAKFQQEHGVQAQGLKESEYVYSHDNIFHTILGAFNIKTRYYKPELDILQNRSI